MLRGRAWPGWQLHPSLAKSGQAPALVEEMDPGQRGLGERRSSLAFALSLH